MGTASTSTCFSSPTFASAHRPRCESARLMERFVAFPSRPCIALPTARTSSSYFRCDSQLCMGHTREIVCVKHGVCVCFVSSSGALTTDIYYLSPAAPPAPGHSLLVTRGSGRPSYINTYLRCVVYVCTYVWMHALCVCALPYVRAACMSAPVPVPVCR